MIEFSPDTFTERAAIIEFDGGKSRFEAETLAARAQGLSRWQALEACRNAHRGGHSARGEYPGSSLAGQSRPDGVPGMQPPAQAMQSADAGSEHHPDAGRRGLVLSALRLEGRGAL